MENIFRSILYISIIISLQGCAHVTYQEIQKYREQNDVYNLLRVVSDSWNVEKVCKAAEALGEIKDPKAVYSLIYQFRYLIKEEQHCIINAIYQIGKPAVNPLIIALSTDHSKKVRECSAITLGLLQDKDAIEPLILALSDEKQKVRKAVHKALVKITKQRFDMNPQDWYDWLDKNKLNKE